MEQVIEKLKSAIKDTDLTKYAAVPFWSWNNELDEKTLVEQVQQMHDAGCGGFIMHARTGLKTEYLGEKWFSCIGACLQKAKELKMNAWIYDENGWPSGFVGGKLLENESYRARFLRYAVQDFFDETAYRVYARNGEGFVCIDGQTDGVTEYHCVYLMISPANTDVLNPEVVEAFIAATHEEYYKRFKDSFGKELVGFFTDEPQYYRWETAYTPMAKKAYFNRFGEELDDGLIHLFTQDEAGREFRIRYYRLLNDLFTETFVKRVYEWCEEHNCKLTGHMVEESNLAMQMWGGAGVTAPYEYEHIPGIDCLGRGCTSDLSVRQAASAAAQLGKKQILTETFAVSGYDVKPSELKCIAEHQFFGGANLMCHHLLPFSVAGQGKIDFPPVFSKHGNWWEQFKEFNDYFTRLGYLVANTKDGYDLAVLHPMRGVYRDYMREEDGASVERLEKSFETLLSYLRKKGVRYHLLDERLLERHGTADGKTLSLGGCEYSAVIVPDMKTVSPSTLALLEEYQGKLCLLGKLLEVEGKAQEIGLTSNCTLEELVAMRGVKFTCEDGRSVMTSRSGELGNYIFVVNTSLEQESEIVFEGVAEKYQALNLMNFTLSNITNRLTLRPSESIILVESENAKAEARREERENITKAFAVTGVSENSLILDYGQISFDGVSYGERMPLQQLFEGLLRQKYKGDLFVRQTFTANDCVPAKLLIEKNRFKSICLNGKPLALQDSDFDIYFAEAEITPLLKTGENELVYLVDYYQHDGVWTALFDPLATESLRNCLYYDTYIESAYIQGDFLVNESREIVGREGYPKISSDTAGQGYPFFKGALTIRGKYRYDGVGKRSLLLQKGRYLVAEVRVNGNRRDIVLDDRVEITDLLQVGENEIEITLRSGLRNFFGPHHNAADPECKSAGPYTFTLRGAWENGVPKEYSHEYFSVAFGIDEIEMLNQSNII